MAAAAAAWCLLLLLLTSYAVQQHLQQTANKV
jgi:cbb3-type cytochrome oxidase subunit 3